MPRHIINSDTDAEIVVSSPVTGEVLKFDGTNWVNATGGGGAVDSVNGSTGVVVLDTDDIDDTATNRYTNDTDVTRLAGTSGTNTGDQNLTPYFNKSVDDSDDITEGVTKLLLTTAERTKLSNTSGVNTGDQNLTPYFNKSVDDSDDITEGVTKLLLTTAERTKLSNTSGVNTGDQNLSGLQPLDSDLTAIAGLSPSNDDLIQRKSGAWTNRTPAQVKTDLVLVKGDVGLGNVDNTSDLNKPISTATQTALDGKVDENAPITPTTVGDATHIPIITYDAKGLITGSTDATISSGTQRTFAYFAG